MRPLWRGALALVTTLVFPASVHGQGARFDEGTFVISRDGVVVGKESFRILRSAGEAQLYSTTAQCALGDTRIAPALSADAAGVPLLYRVEVKRSGDVEERLHATGRPGRLHAVRQTRTGEASKEYVVQQGAVILDEDVIHHHFFVPLAQRSGPLTVVVPRRHAQVAGRVESRGTDKIRVDGTDVSALHYVVSLPDGAREIWVDESGRLLRVALPRRNLVAIREELPR